MFVNNCNKGSQVHVGIFVIKALPETHVITRQSLCNTVATYMDYLHINNLL